MNFNINKNVIELKFNDKKINISVLKEDLFRFFSEPKKSHTIISKRRAKRPNVIDQGSSIKIYTSLYDIVVTEDLLVTIYDGKSGDIVVSDQETILEKSEDLTEAQIRQLLLEGHDIRTKENCLYTVTKTISDNEMFYGLGETTGYLNKKGFEYINWNTDDPSAHVDNYKSLYQSCPFYIGKHKYTYGLFFDDPCKTVFDMGTDLKTVNIRGTKGTLDYYFLGGKNVASVRKRFTDLVGLQTMPSRVMLGNMQSRWSYMNKEKVLEVVDKYEEANIPLDVIFLDIDYMDNYKVFTYNDKTFSNLKEFVALLRSKGVRVVPIIDPGVKKEDGYFMYEEGMEHNYFAMDGNEVFIGKVWPGESLFPAFTNEKVREWWGTHVKELMSLGFLGIWNDMNEPSSFTGQFPETVTFKGDHKVLKNDEAHNIYAHYMSKATYDAILSYTNTRPFLITRAAYAGTHKFSTTWTGDNQAIWEHLRLAVPQLLNMGLSGQSIVGTDIGGFGGDTNKELLIRWAEFASLTSLCRNHAASGSRNQEPYTFDDETTDIYRKHIKLRYSLLPYIYDCFFEEQAKSLPPMRPLFLKYTNDKETYSLNSEYMFGSKLLVAPVVNQGETKKMVYFPDTFYDFYTKERFTKGYKVIDAPLDKLPLFVLKNSIIPTYNESNHIKDSYDTINLEVFGNLGEYTTTYDDGSSLDLSKTDIIKFKVKDNEFTITYKQIDSPVHYKNVVLTFKGDKYEFPLTNENKTYQL